MKSIADLSIHRVALRDNGFHKQHLSDQVAVEEPLQISLAGKMIQTLDGRKNIAITMRTPGQDVDLALGFLYAEGILSSTAQVLEVREEDENKLCVHLAANVKLDLKRLERHFYTSSSCGVCGKASIEAVEHVLEVPTPVHQIRIAGEWLMGLPEKVRAAQSAFQATGGIHAAALFEVGSGELCLLREDVGRHNALDKLIGAAWQKQWLPLEQHLVVLSGRASFELIQKCAMAGVQAVGAVGAPSSLAVELAAQYDMTLIGFLRANRFNIYTAPERVEIF